MKLTNQRKAYAAILSVALSALVIDRVFLGGEVTSPKSAAAEAIATMASESPAPSPPAVTARTDVRTLAASLDQLRRLSTPPVAISTQPPRDTRSFASMTAWKLRNGLDEIDLPSGKGLFSGEVCWLPSRTKIELGAVEQPAPPPTLTIEESLKKYRITGVVDFNMNPARSFVMVDGQQVFVGKSFDGVRVESIAGPVATLTRGSETYTLNFQEHRLKKSGAVRDSSIPDALQGQPAQAGELRK